MKILSLRNLSLIILLGAIIIIAQTVKPAFKKPGSFEYVRKGEILLEKGKYEKAIAYFEKAHKSSPENKDIRFYLAYAYSRYAAVLAESEFYDKAIAYLVKAYDVIKEPNTVQNLALMYSRKALYEARRDNWSAAIEDFTNARLAAYDYDTASKNLSAALFNYAVDEYKSGRERIAIICLKEAYLSDEDPRIAEFLGDIYYKKTDLEKALFYWAKAKDLKSDSSQLDSKLKKSTKELVLAKTEEVRRFPHFDIRYEKTLPIDAKLVNGILEKAYLEVGNDLSYFPDSKTLVFFYSENNFQNIFELPPVVRAFYDGNIRMPLPEIALGEKEMDRYIYHEYTHAIVSAKTNNNCPVWLSEGIAVWEEFKREGFDRFATLNKIGKSHNFSIASLDEAFKTQDKNSEILTLGYLLSYTLVNYIIDNWGMEGLRDILTRLANAQHIINAIDDEFLLSQKEFESRWAAYVRKKFFK